MKTLNLLLFIVSTLTLGWQTARAQSLEVDSLELALSLPAPDSVKIRTINKLVYHYYSDNNAKRLLELSKQGLALVDKIENKQDIGTTYLNYALAAEVVGEYTQSLEYNGKALSVFKSLNDSASISIILNNMGIGYNQLGDYSMAVYYLLRAIEIDEGRKDSLGSSYDYVNLSESYYNAKNYSLAKYWAQKSFIRLQQLKKEEELGYAAETLATAFIELGKLDSAKALITLSQQLANKYDNDYIANRVTGHLGRIFYKEKN